MITASEYIDALAKVVLGGRRPNSHQTNCLAHPPTPDLMIVAGPGSGKTTVLVLRALRHVIVDGVLPEDVVITTFTNKAAAEIRSRLISWGVVLLDHFKEISVQRKDEKLARHLAVCDVNGFMTGTLDSLCEKWNARMRHQGEVPPVMIETFAARQIFSRSVFGAIYRDPSNKAALDDLLAAYTWEKKVPDSQGEAVEVAKTLIDRLVQDLADVEKFAGAAGPHAHARKLIAQCLRELHALMRVRGQYDFALLEADFLRKLQDPILRAKIDLPRVLLIDEYQDTNPLQEAIYFKLAILGSASVTIVGDDDQALYRFRGATVELFRDFRSRFATSTGRSEPAMEYLVDNYRSTVPIVDFCNDFIKNDPNFLPARVTPPKPAIISSGTNNAKQVPILGMFRASPEALATSLAELVHTVFRGNGYSIPGSDVIIRAADGGGDFADAVLMGHSVNEFARPFMGKPGKARLPWMLRQELLARGVNVFNPRGRALKDIPQIRQILGLVCLCIDPDQTLLEGMVMYGNTKRELMAWRTDAQDFEAQNPLPNHPHALAAYVEAWRTSVPQTAGMNAWPQEWPILDLLYKLLAWFPEFQNLPEFQVYLEAITRSVTQATAFSPYQGRLMRDEPHYARSRESVLRDILAPIAENVVEVDEDLLTHLPRNHLNVMTIHQSKGLEFPLVIVDIGADFSRNSPQQRFKRFPDEASNVARMEDDLRDYAEVGALRTRRSSLDRTFEDLIRLYYVAYSRPQTALLLVGHTNQLKYGTSIQNVATFWRQGGSWPWQQNTPVPGKKPPASVSGFGIVEI
ncbi:DNA helicase [Paraburkholderia unamae]|uniref:UvrD-helicase domain-containing protein n=1 Tax=Paraburkholderia unamae TaxID=219649 RepID=UPI001CB38667|nr:ATP-dependent helicase [Paraburkholderia unamae]CAG9261475.1 DNA helicase [Paraburkholderia unamae]